MKRAPISKGLYTLAFIFSTALPDYLQADELPEQAFALARAAIDEAQEVDAGTVAAEELLQAEQKLHRARRYNEEGEELTAKRLLRQSELHAELAEVRAMHASEVATLEQLNRALEDLSQEIRRYQ